MKKKIRSLLALALAVLLVFSLVACGGTNNADGTSAQNGQNGGTSSDNAAGSEDTTFEVVVAASSEPESMDPQLSGAASGGNITYNIFDFLGRMDASGGESVPSLATSWEKVDDTTWRFYLRENVKFSNGEDFNADDVIYTLDRIFEPDSGRTTYNLQVLESWEKVDDYTVDLHTEGVVSDMPTRLYDMAILPNEYCASISAEEFGQNPVGCGPYMLEEWRTNDYISLVYNENYCCLLYTSPSPRDCS